MHSLKKRLPIVAIAAFTLSAAAAQATHWPLGGGDNGRSGFQVSDQASLPMKQRWQRAETVLTSPIVTAGANLTAQRVVWGHISGSQPDLNAAVRLVRFSDGGDPKSVDIDDEATREGGAGTYDDDAFGPAGADVTPLEISGHGDSTPKQVYVVHNDDNETGTRPDNPNANGGSTVVNPLGNDIAIAQINAATGTLRQDVPIGTMSPISGFSTNGYTIESAPVIGPDEAAGTPIIFTMRNAAGTDRRIVKISVPNAANDTVGGNTITTPTATGEEPSVSQNISDLNTKARPAIVYLKDPGSASKQAMVAVSTSTGIRTFRVGNLGAAGAGPAISSLGLTQGVSVPVQSNGNSPTTTPFLYAATTVSGNTVVHKLRQAAGAANDPSLATLESIGQSSELEGTPGPSLAVAQVTTGATTATPGRVLAGTSANLYSLDTENLSSQPAQLFSSAATSAFSKTSPAASGDLGFAADDDGDQFVFDVETLDRAQDDEQGFQVYGAVLNATGSLGQPAVSRGRVVFPANNGAYTYGSAVTILQPAANGTMIGTQPLEAQVYDSAFTSITFKIDGVAVGTAPVVDNKASVPFDSKTILDGLHTIVAEASDGSPTIEASAPRTFTVNNFLPPTAKVTAAPNPANVGQDVTFNASASAPTPSEAGETITRWAYEVDGDNDYNDVPENASIVKFKFTTPGTKTIRVRVTDSHGDTATSEPVTLRVNAPPSFTLTATPNPAAPGQQVTIDASASDSDGSVAKYEFDLDGNGSYELDNGTNPKASKAFTATTTVGARVTDNEGGQTVKTVTVTVAAGNQAPVAAFLVAPNPAKVNQDVGFSAAASKDPDGTIAKYEWDFDGNGTFETNGGASPLIAHKFASAGVYKVGLRVTDNAGATGTKVIDVIITGSSCLTTSRCRPRSLSSTVSPKRDRALPYVFTTRGRLGLPAGLAKADGCAGKVSVQIKLGKKTISTRRVKLRSSCSYTSKVTFRDRKRLGSAKSLRFTARFLGNKLLTPRTASRKTVRIG